MNQPALSTAPAADGVWQSYRSNLPRHLIGLSRYFQTTLMHVMEARRGYQNLRLSYEPFITLVGNDGVRLTELASWLDISKQAASQTANQVEALGLIKRLPDPQDGRAKKLVLTANGRKLIREGGTEAANVAQVFVDAVGTRKVASMARILQDLYQSFALPSVRGSTAVPVALEDHVLLAALLPRIADAIMQKLMHLNMDKGHTELKMSYAQVLTLIGPDGGQIQQMAAIQEVSKQAISAIASELEELGYVERVDYPQDARRFVLQLTNAGQQLLEDSVDSIQQLNINIATMIGNKKLLELQSIAEQMYTALDLESEVFKPGKEPQLGSVKDLAKQLKTQLNRRQLNELSQLLTV